MQGGTVGLAFADSVGLALGLAEFADNDLLSNTEVALIQLGAVECIVAATCSHLERLREIARNCGVALTTLRAGEFAEMAPAELAKLVRDDCFEMLEHPASSLRPAHALVSYLRLLHSDSNLRAFRHTPYNQELYVKLDDTALRSLHIFPAAAGPKTASLYGLLNQCKTGQGSRLLEQWLRQPLRSREDIESRLDAVQAFVEASAVRQNLRETGLRAVPDLARIIRRLVRAACSLQDIVVLYQVLEKTAVLLAELEQLAGSACIHARYIASLGALKAGLAPFSEMVESMLDFPALERHEYIVRADFDEALQAISSQKDELLGRIEPEFARVARRLGLEMNKKLKLERNSIYGYFFRVSRLDAGALKEEEGLQELAIQKNGVYFVTPLLRECSLRYDELCQLYASKQGVLVKEMIRTTAAFRTLFDSLNLAIADLDVCLSLAYVSVMSPKSFVRPQIGGTDLVLRASRHPCLEAHVDFIANDVEFQRDAFCVQIITGPNMGGKSTYIRQAALVIILAQMGCFVPCEYAAVPIFDAVMVRVGAGDSILRGVSTFMAEMLETASILKTASRDSFVIVDELGRGTSTSEGLGLAWGVTKHIARSIGCFTFFATHFHELTALAAELPCLVRNLHVTAQVFQGALTMLYAVRPGVCDQSFGIHVAELANFPRVVVEMAKLRTAELEGTPLVPREQEGEAALWISSALQTLSGTPAEQRRAVLDRLVEAEGPPCIRRIFAAAP